VRAPSWLIQLLDVRIGSLLLLRLSETGALVLLLVRESVPRKFVLLYLTFTA
jgi:hypothetical protein